MPISQIQPERRRGSDDDLARDFQNLGHGGISVAGQPSLLGNRLGSGEQLQDEIRQALLGSGKGTAMDSQNQECSGLHSTFTRQVLEHCFETFLQTLNHFLFLFSESELRESFVPGEHASDETFPVHILLVLALGAKYGAMQVDDLCHEWYAKARMSLLKNHCQDDLWMMRILTLLCILEINDDLDSASHFLGTRW